MVQKEVSKIDPCIEKITEVETFREPSTVIGLDLEDMIPNILPSWVMAKYSCKTQRLEMPLASRIW